MVEGAPLLRAYRRNPIEGSNPSLSAINKPGNAGFFYGAEGRTRTLMVQSRVSGADRAHYSMARRARDLATLNLEFKAALAAQTARITAWPAGREI